MMLKIKVESPPSGELNGSFRIKVIVQNLIPGNAYLIKLSDKDIEHLLITSKSSILCDFRRPGSHDTIELYFDF